MLTLRQMRYFDVLAEHRHFGRAAKSLHISQPALSAQIAQMEAFFGAGLFSRGSQGIAMTPEGEAVRTRIRRILSEVHDLEGFASRPAEPLSGRMRIGMIATVAPYLVPRLLPILSIRYPKLGCEIRESVTDRLFTELSRGEIDCAVVALPLGEEAFETIDLFDDSFHLAVPASKANDLPNPVPASAIAEQRIILLEEGHCLRAQAMDVCRLADDRELSALGATSLTTILRMVAGNLGATLVPGIAIPDETRAGGIEILPLAEPVPYRRLVLAFRPTSARRSDLETLAALMSEAAGR